MTKFEKWFSLQFGALPMSGGRRRLLAKQWVKGQTIAVRARQALDADDVILKQWVAALRARNAMRDFEL